MRFECVLSAVHGAYHVPYSRYHLSTTHRHDNDDDNHGPYLLPTTTTHRHSNDDDNNGDHDGDNVCAATQTPNPSSAAQILPEMVDFRISAAAQLRFPHGAGYLAAEGCSPAVKVHLTVSGVWWEAWCFVDVLWQGPHWLSLVVCCLSPPSSSPSSSC